MALPYVRRPAGGEPEGLLVLHHGRGSSERDLIGLADALDPQRRRLVVSPRAPLTFPGQPGHHWYVVPRIGFPDPETFDQSHRQLAAFHDQLWRETGIGPEATVLGGFSQGSAMSYALGLDGSRPAPGGLLIFSGFIPTVDGWQPDLASRPGLPIFVTHGRRDPVMEIGFARRGVALLRAGGADVEYHETDDGHTIIPSQIRDAQRWLSRLRGPASAAEPAPTRPDR